MKDFNSYVNNERASGDRSEGVENYGGIDVSALLRALAGKYEGADEDAVIAAIVAEAERGRANGTLTDDDLLNFERTVSPMLSAPQRKKLQKVVKYLLGR